MLEPPYRTRLKPYGSALLELARERPDVVCLSGDLTRQCEIDIFEEAFPERFVNGGMAEANIMGMAGGLARRGLVPFVHTFGVFATRRPYDQVAMAIAYPNLPVRIVGFMPGISSPGGPSHQATDDVALMRALPNMTVIDVADATETARIVPAIVDLPGPVYLRLKRGEIPVLFDDDHDVPLDRVQVLRRSPTGGGVTIVASGMTVATAAAATSVLEEAGVPVTLVNAPVIKPLDAAGIVDAATGRDVVVTIENHSTVGGLGSAVAEALAEHPVTARLVRMGLQDRFAEGSRDAPYLFRTYGLTVDALIARAWEATGQPGPAPTSPAVEADHDTYAPV